MSSLLASLLLDSLSEQLPPPADDGDSAGSPPTTPSVEAALRLVASNPQTVLQTGDDGVPNIFFALHSFPVVECILEHFPEQASVVHPSNSSLPLHAACAVPRVPVEVVRLLLSLAPEAASAKSRDGKLALHVAAANATASVQVLAVLLAANPDAVRETESKQQSLPLHYACAFRAPLDSVSALLRSHREAVRVRDLAGNLPLHLAVLYKAPHDVVELLLDEYPEAISLPDAKERLPLHLATIASYPVETVQMLLSRHPAACDVSVPDGGRPPKKPIHFAIRQLSNASVISLLMSASVAQRADLQVCGDTLLHSALEFSAPLDVVQAILHAHPAAAEELNADGKLPLHFAAWHQAPFPVIQLLLKANPEAIKTREPRGGYLPLHFAIQYAPQGPSADVTPALGLLEAYPAAVFEQTLNKGFYPIHLASRSRCPLRLLDALLRFCPFSVGFVDKDGLVPVDYALRMNASADVISRLLGVETVAAAGKGSAEPPKAAHGRSHGQSQGQGQGQGQGQSQDQGQGEGGEEDEKPVGLKEALVALQIKYAEQGEDMRGIRRRMDRQTQELKEKIAEVRGLQHDVSWRDDKIRIQERELDALKKELASLK